MKMKDNKEFIGYVGTYTKENSEGIYKFTLDTEAKKISNVALAAKLDNPTYVTINRNNKYLYSVVKEGESGGVAAYSIDSQTGELKEENRQVVEGASPCHISVDSGNHAVVTANYHKGTIESFEVNEEDGTINPAASIMAHEGSGPNKERQEKPHAHYAGYTPDEKYVVGVDLGIDKILTYEIRDSKLKEVNSLSVNPGSGPRHIIFHPNGKYAYVMTELSSEVITLTYNRKKGLLQSYSIFLPFLKHLVKIIKEVRFIFLLTVVLYMQVIVVIIVLLFSVWIKTQVSLHLLNIHLQKEIGQETLY